jgi:3' terminal RNA ribose 2'-O-methyltransferase Hen1
MFLSISTTHQPATDLGFLLHKNPDRPHDLALAFGHARMFYPEASRDRCTFVLMLDVDPIALIRGKGDGKDRKSPGSGGLLEQYVNDRPYAVSSFLSVAIAQALRTALGGRCAQRPELVMQPIPLEIVLTPLPARGGRALIEQLFAPLGYQIAVETIPLDPHWPDWGDSAYVTLRLSATCRLADLLTHLYVLIPVLDNKKHYYIDADEIEKLLTKGGSWLPAHPARDLIAARYLRRRRALATEAIARLAELSDTAEDEPDNAVAEPDEDGIVTSVKEAAEQKLEKPIRLHETRLDTVAEVLKASGARRVLDLGCGNGKLLKRLMAERQFTDIVGVEVGMRDLEIAARRLRLDTMPERQRARITLLQGALTYRDSRLAGYDAAALVEVIEHIDPDRLVSVERVVFGEAKPDCIVVTTPNRDYNVKFEGMQPGQFRHPDHRFEWTRDEFAAWAEQVCTRFGYVVRLEPLGAVDAELGAPSQMAIFTRGAA